MVTAPYPIGARTKRFKTCGRKSELWILIFIRFAIALPVSWQKLAEAGCTDEQIGAITGQTEQTVKHYTKSVRQKVNAMVAMKARERMLQQNAK